uniref:Putative secreted protein n=1 Tax=Ixodes ricinus TaxID=34613 RepID=A0A6B0TV02_IXORI
MRLREELCCSALTLCAPVRGCTGLRRMLPSHHDDFVEISLLRKSRIRITRRDFSSNRERERQLRRLTWVSVSI